MILLVLRPQEGDRLPVNLRDCNQVVRVGDKAHSIR